MTGELSSNVMMSKEEMMGECSRMYRWDIKDLRWTLFIDECKRKH